MVLSRVACPTFVDTIFSNVQIDKYHFFSVSQAAGVHQRCWQQGPDSVNGGAGSHR
jgi:hypothetical protein